MNSTLLDCSFLGKEPILSTVLATCGKSSYDPEVTLKMTLLLLRVSVWKKGGDNFMTASFLREGQRAAE